MAAGAAQKNRRVPAPVEQDHHLLALFHPLRDSLAQHLGNHGRLSALLEFGAVYGPHFNEVGKPGLQITDLQKFTRAIGQILVAEREQGGTLITEAIDAAVLEVCTNGVPDTCGFIRGEIIMDETASNRKPVESANDAA